MTLRSQLIHFFKQEKYEVHSANLERMSFKNPKTGGTYKPATVGREARRLAEDGVINVKYEKGCAVYWYEKNTYEQLHENIKKGRVEITEDRQIRLI